MKTLHVKTLLTHEVSKIFTYSKQQKLTRRPLKAKYSIVWIVCNFSTWLEVLLNFLNPEFFIIRESALITILNARFCHSFYSDLFWFRSISFVLIASSRQQLYFCNAWDIGFPINRLDNTPREFQKYKLCKFLRRSQLYQFQVCQTVVFWFSSFKSTL